MNFLPGAGCSATSGPCLLGEHGLHAKNEERGCVLHGDFDVWLTQENNVLVTDLGLPSSEPKQFLALKVTVEAAEKLAALKAKEYGGSVLRMQSKCLQCGENFWVSDHEDSARSGFRETARARLCPVCIRQEIGPDVASKLRLLGNWCG